MNSGMREEIRFVKASGAGNDFVLIDNTSGSLAADQPFLASVLCRRHTGIGADGLIVLENSRKADFAMKYYNADGSYGGMCGNGGRCAALFAAENGLARSRLSFEALDFVYRAEVTGGSVKLAMKNPGPITTRKLHIRSDDFDLTCVDTGSPHAVVFEEDLERADVAGIGKEIREHESFKPHGTNVNFVQKGVSAEIPYRTYERGVEAETLACGTGAVAIAIASHFCHATSSPVMLRTRSNENLTVSFQTDGASYTDVILEGPAIILFEGRFLYESISGRISLLNSGR